MSERKDVIVVDGAAIAYRVTFGCAVVSGDPIGNAEAFPRLVHRFADACRQRGWHPVVLGCGEAAVELWRDERVVGRRPMAIPFGRDVVIDVADFRMVGRAFRNLRQAVARTRRCGVTAEIVSERDVTPELLAQLCAVLRASHRRCRMDRGFSMTLDHLLDGRYPGVFLTLGRDRTGRVVGFQRYAQAGGGSDVSLDNGWRRPDAPNGVEERLTVETIEWCRGHGVSRLSLAFAPFPELFDERPRSWGLRIARIASHVLDPVIGLGSLYDYLRKFHSFGRRRFVVVSLGRLPVALVALLALELLPRPLHRPAGRAGTPDVTAARRSVR